MTSPHPIRRRTVAALATIAAAIPAACATAFGGVYAEAFGGTSGGTVTA